VCCTKEGLKFEETEEEKKEREEKASSFEPLCRIIKDILGDKVCVLVPFCRMLQAYWPLKYARRFTAGFCLGNKGF